MLEIKALKFDGTNIDEIVQLIKGTERHYDVEEETIYVVLPDNKCQIIHKNEYAMIIKREQGYSVSGLADFTIEDYPIYKD